MSIIKLRALKLYLEQQEEEILYYLRTKDPEIYGDYYRQKLQETQQHLWRISRMLDQLELSESNRSYLWRCYRKDSSLEHPHKSELNS